MTLHRHRPGQKVDVLPVAVARSCFDLTAMQLVMYCGFEDDIVFTHKMFCFLYCISLYLFCIATISW